MSLLPQTKSHYYLKLKAKGSVSITVYYSYIFFTYSTFIIHNIATSSSTTIY